MPLGGADSGRSRGALLDAGRAVSTDRLVEALWGERPAERPRPSLQNFVSQLRKTLGAGDARDAAARLPCPARRRTSSTSRAYAARRPARATTAPRARLLREALALWRGEPLADFAYERSRRPRSRGSRSCGSRARERIDAELELGRQRELVAELESLVREHRSGSGSAGS